MKIKVTSVLVDDQAKALDFYTNILGFVKKTDDPVGAYRWLTVVEKDTECEIELLLEPNAHPAAVEFQKAIFKDGIPATLFFVDDIQAEFERLTKLEVKFKQNPVEAGPVKIAIFDDTCGNLIQLVQE